MLKTFCLQSYDKKVRNANIVARKVRESEILNVNDRKARLNRAELLRKEMKRPNLSASDTPPIGSLRLSSIHRKMTNATCLQTIVSGFIVGGSLWEGAFGGVAKRNRTRSGVLRVLSEMFVCCGRLQQKGLGRLAVLLVVLLCAEVPEVGVKRFVTCFLLRAEVGDVGGDIREVSAASLNGAADSRKAVADQDLVRGDGG